MSYLRTIIDLQVRWSNRFDQLLPFRFRRDGNKDFLQDFTGPYLKPGTVVYDIGGGKQPMISAQSKMELGMRVVGLDINEKELRSAPAGAYDATICCDITGYHGRNDADVVVCQALLEHVMNTEDAIRAIESTLKPGGVALLFLPSSNAVYAKLNLILPEALKRAILFGIFPGAAKAQGFRAYYDRCTPGQIKHIADRLGLVTEELRLYYYSNYFAFLAPLYALWRAWTLAFYLVDRERAAETFSIALRKPALVLTPNV
jgi:2-polyprenyl-3-methyl-5-hydroxy-6-metoxy-1,4-benzoquinol methylase